MEKTAKERVLEKFDLAADIKQSKVETSIYHIKNVDGKITADFEISGLPVDKKSKDSGYYESSNKNIPKIFNDFDEFSSYAKDFFNKSDEEIISLCKQS